MQPGATARTEERRLIIVTHRRVASTIIEARDRRHSASSSINSTTKTDAET